MDADDSGTACVFHTRLKRAMRVVVVPDDERSVGRCDESEFYEEHLGYEDV